MKKMSFILLLIAGIFLLCSCFGGNRMVIFDDSDKKADLRMEQILETLKDDDPEALKTMFSKQALEEAADFNGSLDYLFEFFQGNVDSWEQEKFTSDTSIEYGKKSVMLISWYIVTTDEDVYKLFVSDYTVNTIDPDNVGLYTLRVIKAEDEATEFAPSREMQIPGIYKPVE